MSPFRANILLLFAGLIWGLGFVAQSTAMENVGPLTFIGLRFVIATIAVAPLALFEAKRATKPLRKQDYSGFLIIGAVLFCGMVLQQSGMVTTTVTNAGFLTGLYVVVVPILGVVLFSQWPHPVVWLCALFSLSGIWMLSGGAIDNFNFGDWQIIFGTLFWGLQVIFIGRYAASSGRPIAMATLQFAACAAFGLIFALIFEEQNWSLIRISMWEIVFTGVFSSAIAFTLQAIGTRYTTAPQAAIFLSSEALFAALFGALLLHERLPLIGIAGCALIFLSMLMVELVPSFRFKKATQS